VYPSGVLAEIRSPNLKRSSVASASSAPPRSLGAWVGLARCKTTVDLVDGVDTDDVGIAASATAEDDAHTAPKIIAATAIMMAEHRLPYVKSVRAIRQDFAFFEWPLNFAPNFTRRPGARRA